MKPTLLWCLKNIETGKSIEGLTFDEARALVSNWPEEALAHWYVWQEGWKDWQKAEDVVGLCEPIHRALRNQAPELNVVSGPKEATQVDEPIEKTRVAPAKSEAVVEGAVSVTPFSVSKSVKEAELREKYPEDSQVVTVSDLISNKTAEIETIEQVDPDRSTDSKEFIVRRHRRYKKEMAITIDCDGRLFGTHTVDVSLGGLLLKDPLPDWVAGYFKVRLTQAHAGTKQTVELTCCLVENQAPGERYRLQVLPLQNNTDEERLEKWLAA